MGPLIGSRCRSDHVPGRRGVTSLLCLLASTTTATILVHTGSEPSLPNTHTGKKHEHFSRTDQQTRCPNIARATPRTNNIRCPRQRTDYSRSTSILLEGTLIPESEKSQNRMHLQRGWLLTWADLCRNAGKVAAGSGRQKGRPCAPLSRVGARSTLGSKRYSILAFQMINCAIAATSGWITARNLIRIVLDCCGITSILTDSRHEAGWIARLRENSFCRK